MAEDGESVPEGVAQADGEEGYMPEDETEVSSKEPDFCLESIPTFIYICVIFSSYTLQLV